MIISNIPSEGYIPKLDYSVPRIAVAVDRNRKLAVAVAVGSLTANENFAKFFRKRKGSPLYFFFISKLLRLAFAVDRKPQACGCGRCCGCGCGRESRPQFGVRENGKKKSKSPRLNLMTITSTEVQKNQTLFTTFQLKPFQNF